MSGNGLVIRKARVYDAARIMRLVNALALQQIMLPRSPASVIENLRDFVVAEIDGKFSGCGALHVVWSDMAEVRSIAVDPKLQKAGIGRRMAEILIDEARELGVPKVFAFTYVPGFFAKLGFSEVEHSELPHKVFNDCKHCPKFHACDEIAMLRVLDPDYEDSMPAMPIRELGTRN
jgi:amino-acid N-acetyltransferase